jgi:hypothetical protein
MNIWPWNKIDALEQKVLELDCHVSELKQALDLSNAMNRTLNARLAAHKSLIKRAHFRNPETGRIGRKGQIFDV